ncbi:group IID secretory phospholipase A2 isoform X2 [Myotis yumanensis]|uniref:group IID secretory phospholipase A2 isoform X2 n=1 Tax=Myotis yumanensis TaxID=159337 RepID=UPI0038D18EB9
MELPLLCALVVFAGVTPTQGGILNLNKMVKQVTRKTPITSYWYYGCHCGLGGKGQPLDATDWCCHAHDCCYRHLKLHHCHYFRDNYNYTFSQGDIQCYEEAGSVRTTPEATHSARSGRGPAPEGKPQEACIPEPPSHESLGELV